MQKVIDAGVLFVPGDPVRLQQVVWNLLSNAIKFTPREGKVQVRLERVNSSVEIVVSDTGQGIEPDFLPYVFDRFRQEDQRTARLHGGMGIGLAIVKQLVELHGGSVSANSRGKDQGSSFTVKLPIVPVYQVDAEEGRVHPAAVPAVHEGVHGRDPAVLGGSTVRARRGAARADRRGPARRRALSRCQRRGSGRAQAGTTPATSAAGDAVQGDPRAGAWRRVAGEASRGRRGAG